MGLSPSALLIAHEPEQPRYGWLGLPTDEFLVTLQGISSGIVRGRSSIG
jgi:hypothetical protein